MAYQKLQASLATEVTPSDTADIVSSATSKNTGCVLYVGSSGDLKVTTAAGSVVTFAGVQVGFFPVQVKRVWATGTSASNIVALW